MCTHWRSAPVKMADYGRTSRTLNFMMHTMPKNADSPLVSFDPFILQSASLWSTVLSNTALSAASSAELLNMMHVDDAIMVRDVVAFVRRLCSQSSLVSNVAVIFADQTQLQSIPVCNICFKYHRVSAERTPLRSAETRNYFIPFCISFCSRIARK